MTTCRIPLDDGWGYIWGAYGQTWTQKKQDAATREQTVKYGQQWVGHKVTDCSGLFVWAFKQYDQHIYHGSNTIWKKYCSAQGKLVKGHRDDGIKLRPGTAVFLLDETGRHHIGVYVWGDTVIEAKGTKWGVVTSKPSHWDEWGELKDVDYSEYPEEKDGDFGMPTLKRGDTGASVKELQRRLNDMGYNCGAVDGKFGSKTETAVKALQEASGLTPDGVVGKYTWQALGINTGDSDANDGQHGTQVLDGIIIDRERLREWRDQMSEIIDEIDRLLV